MFKFEETGELNVLQGRGRKRISNETVGDATVVVVERVPGSQHS